MSKPSPSNKSLTKSLIRLPLGTPLADVKALFGQRWTALKPRDQGWVLRRNGLPVGLRFDQQGLLAYLDCNANSPKLQIQQLSPAMSLEQAQTIYPQLTLTADAELEQLGILSYSTPLEDGNRLEIRCRNQQLIAITLDNPNACYPDNTQLLEPEAHIYLQAETQSCRFFADPNFKLAVLGELNQRQLINLGDRQQLTDFVYRQPTDTADLPFGLVQPVLDYLSHYPLTDDLLARLTSVSVDFSDDIYCYCFNYWDGEGQEFDVSSLTGIGHCINLETLYLTCGCDGVSLTPLQTLKKLRHIYTDGLAFTDYEILLALPQLESVNGLLEHIPAAIATQLQARNIVLN